LSTPFQNRLVGTVIVAAIAIIFLPDLLDGDKKTYQEEFEKIPQSPKVDFSPKNQSFPSEKIANLPQDELSDDIALDDASADKAGANKVEIANKTSSNTASNSKKVKINTLAKQDDITEVIQKKKNNRLPETAIAKQAWVIQLGSFRHKNNVEELVNKLKAKGYTVFTKPIKTKNGNLTKVFVGPELIKSSLEKKIPALKQLTDVQGKMARFSPAK